MPEKQLEVYCEDASKKLRRSASSTQFTFFVVIPTANASNA
jgi:hypothetical protein